MSCLSDVTQALPEQAQCLFLRLYQRRGPWFRQRALEYPEVGKAADAIVQLVDAGSLAMAEDSDTAELVQVQLDIPMLLVPLPIFATWPRAGTHA